MNEEKELKQNNLLKQILRFAVTGGLSFVIDFAITNVIALFLRKTGISPTNAAMIGAVFGFVISVIFNYILSMHWVFDRDENMDRRKEFIIFIVLSVIGLGINELIILICMTMIENIGWCNAFTAWVQKVANFFLPMTFDGTATAGSKVVATAIVMVYNFVTRKMFLEKKKS